MARERYSNEIEAEREERKDLIGYVFAPSFSRPLLSVHFLASKNWPRGMKQNLSTRESGRKSDKSRVAGSRGSRIKGLREIMGNEIDNRIERE